MGRCPPTGSAGRSGGVPRRKQGDADRDEAPPSRWKVVRAAALPAWGRTVLTLLASIVVVRAAGLGSLEGYAVVPAYFFALAPLTGAVLERVAAVAASTAVMAGLSALGAEVAQHALSTALALAVMGFVLSLLPRVGPRAAAMATPLLIGFAYSAGQPPGQASAGHRAAAVLVALPVYVLGTAVLFRNNQRRALRLSAAAALDTIGQAAEDLAHGHADGVADRTEAGLTEFRKTATKASEPFAPLDSSADAQATQLLIVSLHRAAAGAVLSAEAVADDPPGAVDRRRLVLLAQASAQCADSLTRRTGSPDTAELDGLTQQRAPARLAEGVRELAGALADAARAAQALNGNVAAMRERLIGPLPSPLVRVRASLVPDDPAFRRAVRLAAACGVVGLIAELSDLGRTYWAVFAVVVVLNAPAARDRRRAVERIAGTVVGFLLAVPLMTLVDGRPNLALAIGMAFILPGLMLAMLSYGYAVVFLTGTAAMLMSAGGRQADFLRFRVAENVLGASVVIVVGTLLWHTTSSDWWLSARSMARALTAAFRAERPEPYRDRLVTKVLALRAATAEAQEIPNTPMEFGPTWTFLSAAEDLVRTRAGPNAGPVPDRAEVAARLERVEAACLPGRVEAARPRPVEPDTTLASEEVARMERAVTALLASETGTE